MTIVYFHCMGAEYYRSDQSCCPNDGSENPHHSTVVDVVRSLSTITYDVLHREGVGEEGLMNVLLASGLSSYPTVLRVDQLGRGDALQLLELASRRNTEILGLFPKGKLSTDLAAARRELQLPYVCSRDHPGVWLLLDPQKRIDPVLLSVQGISGDDYERALRGDYGTLEVKSHTVGAINPPLLKAGSARNSRDRDTYPRPSNVCPWDI